MADEPTKQDPPEQPPQAGADEGKATEPEQDKGADAFDGDFDAERAKKLIANLRADKQKQSTQLTAAQEKAAKLDELMKLLGGGDEPDPAKLQQTLTEREEKLREIQVDRAIEKAAGKHGGDADLVAAVLFRNGKAKAFKPDADDFAETVDAAVQEAISDNPRLKAGSPAPDLKQGVRGGSESKGQLSAADLDSMTPAEIMQARREGRLDRALGKSS